MKTYPAAVWRDNDSRRMFLGVEGKVVAFSVVRQGPGQLDRRTPYVIALIVCGGEKVLAQLTDCDSKEVFVGMEVVGVLRKLYDVPSDSLLRYGVKFAPVRKDL